MRRGENPFFSLKCFVKMLSEVSVVKTDFETFTFSYCSRVKRKASIKYLGTNSITGGLVQRYWWPNIFKLWEDWTRHSTTSVK